MNAMEEIFEIRSCIEILVNDIKVDTTDAVQDCAQVEHYRTLMLSSHALYFARNAISQH